MFRTGLAALLSLVLLAGCMAPKGETAAEKRQAAQQMRSDALTQLYEIHPYAQGQIEEAAGYAVFSNVGVNLFLLSTASGWGIVREAGTGQDTYMKMYSVGIGPGLGVKDFRGIFVFTDPEALDSFIEDG